MNLRKMWNNLSIWEKMTHMSVSGVTTLFTMIYGMSELMFNVDPQGTKEKVCENLQGLVEEASCAVSANINCTLPNIPLDEYFQMVRNNCQNADMIIDNADPRQLWSTLAETAAIFYACVIALNLFFRATKYACDTHAQKNARAMTEEKTEKNSTSVAVQEPQTKASKTSKCDWTRLCCWRKGEREPLLSSADTTSSHTIRMSRSSE